MQARRSPPPVDVKRPAAIAGGWVDRGVDPRNGAHVWDHVSGLRVLTAVELVQGESPRSDIAWHHHLSVSMAGHRASPGEALAALAAFALEGAEEDNHVPGGIARNFWLEVGLDVQPACPCKATEPPHEEPGGYVWREVPGT